MTDQPTNESTKPITYSKSAPCTSDDLFMPFSNSDTLANFDAENIALLAWLAEREYAECQVRGICFSAGRNDECVNAEMGLVCSAKNVVRSQSWIILSLF